MTAATAPARKGALFLTKYGRRAAATRHRFLQYFPYLEAAGIDCHVSPMLSDRYLERKLEAGTVDVGQVAAGIVNRIGMLRRVRRFDVAIVHMEALPYLPALFENTLVRLGVPYIYDFDDASFHQYDQSASRVVRTLLGGKVARVIAGASLVMAGNDYLAAYARRHNSSVEVVPTVVDTTRFVPAPPRHEPRVVIGWIGSPSTARYVEQLAAVWRAVTAPDDCVLRLVGSGRVNLPGARVDVRRWSEAREIEDLQGFDIGIMPLADDPWSRGKCGFKLIESMACGAPVVASPVGVNRQIIHDGRNGFLCATGAEWIARLRQLVADPILRQRMGARGRADAVAEWSLDRWAPDVTRLIRSVATGERLPLTRRVSR